MTRSTLRKTAIRIWAGDGWASVSVVEARWLQCIDKRAGLSMLCSQYALEHQHNSVSSVGPLFLYLYLY